ncbi:MAG TPA: hypothetical protein VI316_06630 [Candidatus Dormibacteraeota bacterium]
MCGHPGCPAQPLTPCAYAERMRRPCGTQWCADHGHGVEGRWFCPRHGAIVAALLATGDLSAEPMSDISSPAATLLLSISAGVDEGVDGVLHQASWRWPGSSVLREALFLRHLRERRERVWESSWKLIDATGALAGVALVLPERDPGTLFVRVDHRDMATLDLKHALAALHALPAGQPAALPSAELVETIVACTSRALDIDADRPAGRGLRELLGLPVERRAPAAGGASAGTAWQRRGAR